MQILVLPGMYFDAVVVFVTSQTDWLWSYCALANEEIKTYMTIGQPQTSTNLCLLFRTVPKETTGAASTIQEKVEKKPSFISAARVARGLGLKR